MFRKILSFILIIIFSYIIGFAYTNTPNLNLKLMAETDDTYTVISCVNDNFDLVDDVFNTVSLTEFGYLDGVTSAIQTQLNTKQPLDAQLTDIAGLTPTDSYFIVGDGVNFITETGATVRTSLGLAIGTDVQAYDAGLLSLAGLTWVSDSFIKVTATDVYAIRTIAETKTDLSLNLVENTALSTWAGTANITTLGTIGTGAWNADVIADGKIASALTGKTYNALTLTAAATGFTIAGGTTSKTLTLDDNFVASTQLAAISANTAKVTESTTVTAPLVKTTYDISIPVATTSVDGYLSSANWNTFNDKQSALPVVDTQTIIKGSVDATKLMRFEVDGLTTATTRVLTVQDKDITIADNADVNLKAPLASPTFTGTVTIPTPFTLGAVSVLPTGTELNYVDGVTSAIQTQLDSKAVKGANSDITSLTGLTTPLGAAYGGTGVSNAAGETITLTGGFALDLTLTAATAITLPTTGTVAVTANKLSDFAATTSAELTEVISDETGTGLLVFGTSPTFTTQITTPTIAGITSNIKTTGQNRFVVAVDGEEITRLLQATNAAETAEYWGLNISTTEVIYASSSRAHKFLGGSVGIGLSPTAKLTLPAGTATAGTAPLKFTSGTLLTTPEAGATEFLTDAYYGTITTGTVRKAFMLGATAALTSAATIAVDWNNASVYTLTPAENATLNASGGQSGNMYSIVITTSGTTAYTLTFGTAFKTTGTLATGTTTAKVFTINFVYDGTNFNEMSRTTAM